MIILFFLILSLALLVLVHEWGHFFAARFLEVRVQEFGFGFPPRLFSRIRNGVRYSFNLFPLGGFVKIFGEQGEGSGDPQSFITRSPGQRAFIISAGVFMNCVAAWIFFTSAAGIGLPQISEDASVPISVIGVAPDSPAEHAGLRIGDQIIELKSADIALRPEKEEDISDFIQAYRGEEIRLFIRRGDEKKEIRAIPRGYAPEGEGPLGIALGRLALERVSWLRAPGEGLKVLGATALITFRGLGRIVSDLLTSGTTHTPLSGPVGIFFIARDTSAFGIAYMMQFIGLLSVNLAVLNVLPIPALDGGRLALLLLEKIRGTRLPAKTENIIHGTGFAFLILLMILVTYRDIARLF